MRLLGRRLILIAVLLLASACDTAATGRTPGAPVVTPTAPPTPSPDPSFVRPTPLPSPTFLVYEVRPGDSLTLIAREFGTTARSIAYWNRDTYPSLDPDSPSYDPDSIRIGWTLRLIPTAVVDEDELSGPSPTPATPHSPAASPAPS